MQVDPPGCPCSIHECFLMSVPRYDIHLHMKLYHSVMGTQDVDSNTDDLVDYNSSPCTLYRQAKKLKYKLLHNFDFKVHMKPQMILKKTLDQYKTS